MFIESSCIFISHDWALALCFYPRPLLPLDPRRSERGWVDGHKKVVARYHWRWPALERPIDLLSPLFGALVTVRLLRFLSLLLVFSLSCFIGCTSLHCLVSIISHMVLGTKGYASCGGLMKCAPRPQPLLQGALTLASCGGSYDCCSYTIAVAPHTRILLGAVSHPPVCPLLHACCCGTV